MTEKEFWSCTLRKLILLWDDYRVFQGYEKPEKKVYVDDIF
jgi:hypothetical protein